MVVGAPECGVKAFDERKQHGVNTSSILALDSKGGSSIHGTPVLHAHRREFPLIISSAALSARARPDGELTGWHFPCCILKMLVCMCVVM